MLELGGPCGALTGSTSAIVFAVNSKTFLSDIEFATEFQICTFDPLGIDVQVNEVEDTSETVGTVVFKGEGGYLSRFFLIRI